jgi:IclR family acetate operon transcriptional repressor
MSSEVSELMVGKTKRGAPLKSAEKTLDVLEFLSSRGSIGVAELANLKGIGVSTAYRILTTLVARGFAVQDPKTRKYELGPKIFQLAKASARNSRD